ncbi:hypothetical protein UR09_02265 [Candidatus Nitromaritima sp. SCGC AAA799-A02]|nr:hypothetical protein UR09_02265 [Candidatus Nitromaritima sp. SCGC AAA799-A02]
MIPLLAGGSPLHAAEQSLKFSFDNTTFFKNLEYNDITEIVKGETLTGDIARPYFTYHFKKGLKAEIGAIVNFPFGEDDRIDKVDPVVSLNYDLYPGWRLTAGTLHRDHPLLDAIFNDDLEFTDRVEQGFQIRAKTKHLRQDLWIDWERRESADRREKFSIGNYTQFRKDGFMFEAQGLWNHLGGQKNLGGEVGNNFNLAFGGGITFSAPDKSRRHPLIERFGIKLHFVYTKDKPRSLKVAVEPDSTSEGFLTELFAVVGGTDVFLKFWNSNRTRGSDNGQTLVATPFLQGIRADKGDPLYRAEDFAQGGFARSWQITDEVDILARLEFTRVSEQLVHVDTLSVRWRTDFPLWEKKTAPKSRLLPTHPVTSETDWETSPRLREELEEGFEDEWTAPSPGQPRTEKKRTSPRNRDQTYRRPRLAR